MPVNTCVYCGTVFPGRKNAKYCNVDCYRRKQAEEVAAKPRLSQQTLQMDSCQFNEGVSCFPVGDCDKCGWNPDVAQKRFDRILAKILGVEVLHGRT